MAPTARQLTSPQRLFAKLKRDIKWVADGSMSLRSKVIIVEAIEFLVIALGLFVPAGTLAWPAAWVFLGLLFVCSLPIT
jgi:hypothetical protein